jgi:hypothetical protein
MFTFIMPDWGAWARRGLSVAAAPMTGGLSLAGLAPDVPGFGGAMDSVKGFLLGQKPGDVQLPPGYLEAQQRQRAALDQLQGQVNALNPEHAAQDAEAAAMRRGALNSMQMAQQQKSAAAGVRGYGALGAQRQAAINTGAGAAAIGAQASAQAAADRLGALSNAQRLQMQGQGMLLSAEQQAMQQALMEEEWRKQMARPGALDAFLGTIGAAGGAYFGGPQGAAAGGQLGQGLGGAIRTGAGY